MPMCMPMNPGMMVPVLPVQPAPMICPPNAMNMCSSSTMTNEYDSHMYGRFRHVGRDHPQYRHVPFEWYRPPKQRHNVIHEDAAVVTLDGPIPLGDFYRYYIYGEDISECDSDVTSYDDKSFYEERSTGYRRQSHTEPARAFPTIRRPINPPVRNIRSAGVDDDFNDVASVNSTYAN